MKGTPLTEQTYNYIVENFAVEEAMLLQLMQKRAEEAGIPMIMISEEQAKFLGFFLKAIRAKRVLDIGTLFGYSAAIMAKAIGTDGEVVTLEFEPLHANAARANFKHLGLQNISLLQGPAIDHMKTMKDGIFDFIMIDADKPNYSLYLKESLRLIKDGGVIAGDNALAWGKIANMHLPVYDPDYVSATAMQQFNREFAADKSMFSCIVPVGDGLAMGYVKKS
ncbi:MAG: O-methyltransferase [Bacteroidota bacterium]|nr:O-methyltransferase [Bacteroidota bacterium]MDP4230236.1 O-methyltransferase [Bacteroidota bacterium]MDP4236508.1 O-methyltransferase [Bacteroidota bacterium]